jgi:hypothetical protein
MLLADLRKTVAVGGLTVVRIGLPLLGIWLLGLALKRFTGDGRSVER